MAPNGEHDIPYARILTERLPAEMLLPAPGRVLWVPANVVIIAICTIAIVDGGIGALASLACSAAIGLSFCSLGILAHEILHGAVVENRRLRHFLGTICLAPLLIGPGFWMMWHNIHHGHTQNPKSDPDSWGSMDSFPMDRGMRFLRRVLHPWSPLFPVLLATGVTAHAAALIFAIQMTRRQRLMMLAEFFVPVIFWISMGYWLGWRHLVFFFVIPLLIANLVVNSFVVTNHFLNPLSESGDVLAGSLTVTLPRWVERLLLNFNYHVEHHLLPGMSPKYAPQVAQLLREVWPDRYHHMPYLRALLAVWRTPRLYFDNIYLIDLRDRSLYGTLGHGLDAHGIKLRPAP